MNNAEKAVQDRQGYSDFTEKLKEKWPSPPDNPADRIRHTVEAFVNEPDDRSVITATHSVYGPGVTTGLTLGDLRYLAHILDVFADEIERVID